MQENRKNMKRKLVVTLAFLVKNHTQLGQIGYAKSIASM